MPRKQSALTQDNKDFVDAKLAGLSNIAAGIAIGISGDGGKSMANSQRVKEEIARAREQLSDMTSLKRLDVISGIMEAIDYARMVADPQAMIKGWTEIAKILGHYAPEIKKIEITHSQGKLRSKYEAMSDETLLAIAEGRIIEGDYTEE